MPRDPGPELYQPSSLESLPVTLLGWQGSPPNYSWRAPRLFMREIRFAYFTAHGLSWIDTVAIGKGADTWVLHADWPGKLHESRLYLVT